MANKEANALHNCIYVYVCAYVCVDVALENGSGEGGLPLNQKGMDENDQRQQWIHLYKL